MKGKSKNKVAAYLRTASGREGLEQQRKAVREYAEKNNFRNVEHWDVEGVSGNASIHERKLDEVFEKLGAGDTLIVTDLSRLGRNSTDSNEILEKFKRKGIKVICVD